MADIIYYINSYRLIQASYPLIAMKIIREGAIISNTELDIYLKIKCFYNAKTELYDRTLTDKRSPHDQTEAWIIGESRGISSCNAIRLYRKCQRLISDLTHVPFNRDIWNVCDGAYKNLSAQGWIDLYNHFKEIGEMNFIEN